MGNATSSEEGATASNVRSSEEGEIQMGKDQKRPMIGQYFNYQNGRHGSIFKNEMLFHMYTRMKDGFCDLCDLEPENISEINGYKQPGHLFHSKAKEFKDPFFPNWKSDQIFVETNDKQYIWTRVFQYDNEGINALKEFLRIEYTLMFLCGAEELSPCFKDFFFSQDSQVGLIVRHQFGYTYQYSSNLPKVNFRLNLDDLDLSNLPFGVVHRVLYGYRCFFRFHSDALSIPELEEKVGLFGEVIKKNEEEILPEELRDVRGCNIQLHVGSYYEDLERTKEFNSFESAFEHLKICSEGMKKRKRGKGMVYYYDVMEMKEYENLMFAGENGKNSEIIKKIKELPKKYRWIKEEHIGPHDSYKILSDVILLLKEFQKIESRPISELKITFEDGFKNFQNRLGKAIDAFFKKEGPEDCIRKELDKFMNSDLNPERVKKSILKSLSLFCSVTYSSEPKKVEKVESNSLLGHVCPASWEGGCPNRYQRWTCKVCSQLLRFDPRRSEVNCQCGSVPLNDCVFRCDHPNHGLMPMSPDLLLSRKQPRAEINCLLIGESGAGKSTLLNSLVNYTLYGSLEEAEHKDPIFLIPTAYTNYQDEDNEVTHPFGSDVNEQLMDGRTHTLNFKNYIIPLVGSSQKVIRFIDSHGFEPESEVTEDQLESFLEVTSTHRDLHAICWVINSCQPRLSQGFLSAFRRMTSLLTEDQLKSFVFVFTHYTEEQINRKLVGQVKKLQAESKDQNQVVFKMNNEAFPHLVSRLAGAHNTSVLEHELSRIGYNWKQSSLVCKEFCDWLSKMEPQTFSGKHEFILDYDPLEEVVFQAESFKVSCKLQLKMSGLTIRLPCDVKREEEELAAVQQSMSGLTIRLPCDLRREEEDEHLAAVQLRTSQASFPCNLVLKEEECNKAAASNC